MASLKRTAFAACVSLGMLTAPALAQDSMSEDECMTLVLAMSKLELAMVGKAGMTPAEARSGLEALQPDLPGDVSATINELKDVSKSAEGIKVGDTAYFHVTNLEQDWDVPHGFTVKGANTAELLVMPGETRTLVWQPDRAGVAPFYCTDFCSALHQEMQGYVRVAPADANPEIKYGTGS